MILRARITRTMKLVNIYLTNNNAHATVGAIPLFLGYLCVY